jgi:class 3 adenylate cyclase
MSTPPVKRKLAAILAADAVGYSRAMAADEEGTVKILAAHRAVIDGIIQFHEGRIVNTAGDSVIAEFGSPTQAVRCAVEIQDALKTRNDSLAEDKRMQFRIGVNLGDVMVKGDDLLGDGVNVAARLESIAEPGGIYVASSVYDQIAGKLDLGFSDLGEQSLKNIDRPVRAYRVDRDKRATPAARKQQKRSPMPWVAAGLVVVAVGAGATWYAGQQSAARQAEDAKAKADVDAVRARADAELAKARAEADEAKKAAAAATDSAVAAKRALEEQRTAEQLARAQAQVAAARAEAEATRRKADAEVAAATEARRTAEAAAAKSAIAVKTAAKPAPSYAGAWTAIFNCVKFDEMPAETFTIPATFAGGRFEGLRGKPPEAGAMQFGGAPQADGSLQLTGRGYSLRKQYLGQPYDVSFSGKIAADRYEGRGKLGTRDCGLALVRAGQTQTSAASPTGKAAAARSYEGQWSGTFACSGGNEPDRTFPAQVRYSAKGFEVQANKPGQGGYRLLTGAPQPDGNMRLVGNVFRDANTSIAASVEGRFSGDRYEGRGKFLARDCKLTFARS